MTEPTVPDASSRSPISYASVNDGEALFRAEIGALIEGGARRFCDVGGGAHPIVGLKQIRKWSLEYVVLDESHDELARADSDYQRFQADILGPGTVPELARRWGAFDVVTSRWTAEHIRDGRRFHEQVFRLLRPGGTAVHYFPTLYSPPFLLNRLLEPGMSSTLLYRLFPRRKVKFPAYYSWCRGPTRRQIRRLESIGFSVDRYVGFYGHGMYRRVPPVHAAHKALAARLVDHPLPSLTSFALVVLTRPGVPAGAVEEPVG
jgi:SAM-dependent methyltransferase